MADRRPPVDQLVDVVSAGVTPAFKAAARRRAGKNRLGVADHGRAALSERLTADGIGHRRPSSPGGPRSPREEKP